MAKKKPVDSVKVRMYRQGFGDCFLLSYFQGKTCVFTMLIDCGIKYNTKSDDVPIETVIEDLKDTLQPKKPGEKPHLDVLVATHEHWDHIAYFHPTRHDNKNYFADFDIGQVWLAWTENPNDKESQKINSRLRDGAAALQVAALQLQKAEQNEIKQTKGFYFGDNVAKARTGFNTQMDNVLGFYGVGIKEVSESGIKYKSNGRVSSMTQDAIENIISLVEETGDIKYFSPGTTVDRRLVPEGINIYVLGPPRSSLINKSNPSRGHAHETYLSIDNSGMTSFVDGLLGMGASDGEQTPVDSASPFGELVGMDEKKAKSHEYFKDTYFAGKEAYRRIENNWLDIAGQFALQLDGAINNTSLVLAIEFADSGKVLLFPGDAQVGSWLSWHDHQWKVGEGSSSSTRTATDLLNKTVLYKVSHHGSHNATVKEKGLELMTHPDLVAMIPEKEGSYSGILYQPLMERLNELCKGRVLVSADLNHNPQKLLDDKPDELSAVEWDSFKSNLVVEKAYVEYTIES